MQLIGKPGGQLSASASPLRVGLKPEEEEDSFRSGRHKWRHGTVLREIVKQLVSGILRARTMGNTDGEKTRTGISFKTEEGNAENLLQIPWPD